MQVSEQLGRHNEQMEKALEKQLRMESKISTIEEQLQ